MKTVAPVVSGKQIIFKIEEGRIVKGTERMVSLGGGIRASVGKDKAGKTVVESYQFDRDRFDEKGAEAWLEKNSDSIDKSIAKVQENAPTGSFMDITMRLQAELADSGLFPSDSYGNSMAYICYVFPDYCVVDYNGEYWRIGYSEQDGEIELDTPQKADMQFVAKESGRQKARIDRSLKEGVEFFSSAVTEAKVNADTKEAVIVLIEAGKNYTKNRYYPKSTLKEAAGLFAGLKMFLNHPTAQEEKDRPERDLGDWMSTIEESWYEDGKIMARVKIHNDDFWNKLKEDKVFRDNIAVSIIASGKMSMSEIDGVQMQVVEKIANPKSVDWVTEPGARGRVEYIIESGRVIMKQTKENDMSILKDVKLAEVKTERPDIIEAIRAEVEQGNEKKIQEGITKGLEIKAKEDAATKLKESRAAKILEMVNGAKMPKRSAERLVKELNAKEYASDADLEKSVKEAITEELKFIAEVGGRAIQSPAGNAAETLVESSQKDLESRLGLEEKKEDEKK